MWVDAQSPPLEPHLDALAEQVREDLRARGVSAPGREPLRASEFLDLAKLQRDLIAKGATHWAAIHEVGNAPGGPYYVTDNYRRTAQSLVKFRVAARPASLYTIVHSVLRGLDELKTFAGRAHGNLKPSNVLMTGSKRRLKVALTDPAPAAFRTREAEEADLHAVGELIHQLVLHEKPPAVVQSIPPSEAWSRLRQGEKWRELCNRLLNPAGDEMPSRADVLKVVADLRPRRSPVRVIAYVTVALLVLATALLVPWYRDNNRTWQQLVDQGSLAERDRTVSSRLIRSRAG